MEKIIIISLGLVAVVVSTICLHSLFNIKEWNTKHIKNLKSKDKNKSKNKKEDKKEKEKVPVIYQKIVNSIIKDDFSKAPIFMYTIVSSILILMLAIIIYCLSWWYSLT